MKLATIFTLTALIGGGSLALGLLAMNPTQAERMDPLAMNHGGMMGGMDHSGMDKGEMMDDMDHSDMGHAMDLGPADANYDLRFIDGMIPHHEGAVVMAQEALEKSQRPEILELAEAIIAAQADEIAQMANWRADWYADASPQLQMWDAGMGHMMRMSAEMEANMRMDVSLGEADDDFDLRFIEAMIPHHEGALVMAEDALDKSERPEILELAQAILASQQAEIEQMESWKQEWYGQ